MQPRTLLEVLIEVENILPDVRTFISEMKKQGKKILEGGDMDLKDQGSSNLNNLLIELEHKYKNTPRSTLEKNILARTETAIHCSHLYIDEIKIVMTEYMQTVSRLLYGLSREAHLNLPTSTTTFPSQANGRNTVQTLFPTATVLTSKDAKPAAEPATKTSNVM